MSEILNGLNEQQIKAVTYDQGPLLVLAGPGAGKTTVLTRRIAYILSKSKGEHFKVLALTFTNKAAKEMKERVEELVGEEAKRVFIGTFHSFSHGLIRAYGNYIGISPDSVIYDKPGDYIQLLIDGVRKRVDNERKGDVEPTILSEKYRDVTIIEETMPDFYYTIIKLKNRSIFHDDLSYLRKMQPEELGLIYEIYSNELKNASALDFPDLILYANKLLKEKPFILKQVQKIYKHVLIDEGQDTNKSQFELITTICGDYFWNLFIVADEDQLIFEWNDARFEYLVSLIEKYKAETIQLYESYRCPPQVLKAAYRLIIHNKRRIETKEELLPKRGETDESIMVNPPFENQDDEARFVCNKIKDLNRYTDTCVISRNRYLRENIRKELDELSIPYYMPIGQERFLTREMNLIITLMRLVFNEDDKVRLYYICEYFEVAYERIMERGKEKTLLQNLIDVAKKNPELENITTILNVFRNNKNNFKTYYEKLKEVIIEINVKDEDLSEDFEKHPKTSENTTKIYKEENGTMSKSKSSYEDLSEDIKLFEETYQHYTYDRKPEEKGLGDFLNYMSLSPKKDLRNKGVALLTGHAAKGLEFDFVFLISLNQGIFPDYRAKGGSSALEEERRNCFMAITRTKEKLFISYTRFKNTRYGLRQHEPSQFLKEMGY
jgi:DNA helicase-2/ATP-dependent DNA helicase PcrA